MPLDPLVRGGISVDPADALSEQDAWESKLKQRTLVERLTLDWTLDHAVAVYAIGPADRTIEVVKIGFSKDPIKRLRGIQTNFPWPLEIYGAEPGSEEIEKALHKLFVGYRVNGEWFKVKGPVKKFVEDIADDAVSALDRAFD